MAFWIDFSIEGFLELDDIMVSIISSDVFFRNKCNLFLFGIEYYLSAIIDKNLVLLVGKYEHNRILSSYVFFQSHIFRDI